jgi:uncharacterized membrane protein
MLDANGNVVMPATEWSAIYAVLVALAFIVVVIIVSQFFPRNRR